jgi:hypothetical protein
MATVLIDEEVIGEVVEGIFQATEKAIRMRPAAYSLLLHYLERAAEMVDVDQWEDFAGAIASRCRQLAYNMPGTIFYNPGKRIDPGTYGSAKTFRRECKNLMASIEKFNDWKRRVGE